MKKRRGFWRRWFRPKRKRTEGGFASADISRLFSDWVTSSKSVNKNLRDSLALIRARSRDFCENSDYGKKFMSLIKTNVVGANGITVQPKVLQRGSADELDAGANDAIAEAWKQWTKKENCCVNGLYSFVDVQNIVATSVARDGEAIVRFVKNFRDNKFRFALQLLDPDYLDERFNDEARRIRMGVECNKWGRPIRYHLLNSHPGDYYWNSQTARERYYLSADYILHLFVTDRPEQRRGIPWAQTALKRMKMASGYEESELVAARVGAAKMGFFQDAKNTGYMGDDEEDNNTITEVRPGGMERLPAGVEFKAFDIDHPSTAFDAFMKSILKGAASGLNVQYSSLTSDLREANYSSLRQGLIEERDAWQAIQGFYIEHLVRPVYQNFLDWSIASGQLRLPPRDIERFQRVNFQGRRWPWVDPQKDLSANQIAVDMGIKSRTMVAAEQGRDIEDVFAEIQRENQLADKYGVTFKNNGGSTNEPEENEETDEGTEPDVIPGLSNPPR